MSKKYKNLKKYKKYRLNDNETLCYCYAIHVSNKSLIKTKILKLYHDDSSTNYFEIEKTMSLI